jgi:hypothetical protein
MSDQINAIGGNNKISAGFNNFINGFSTGEHDFKAVLKKTPLFDFAKAHDPQLQAQAGSSSSTASTGI